MKPAHWLPILALIVLLPAAADDAIATPKWPLALHTAADATTPIPAPDAKATVLVFTTPGCPIANRYAPALAEIARDFADTTRFYRVYADPDTSPADATAHEQAYHYGFPALFDPEQESVALTGATRTPEIAVLDPSGALRYLGAVDDQYTDFGTYRRAATTHYLRDALTAVLTGKEVPTPRTDALGCYIPERKTDSKNAVSTP